MSPEYKSKQEFVDALNAKYPHLLDEPLTVAAFDTDVGVNKMLSLIECNIQTDEALIAAGTNRGNVRDVLNLWGMHLRKSQLEEIVNPSTFVLETKDGDVELRGLYAVNMEPVPSIVFDKPIDLTVNVTLNYLDSPKVNFNYLLKDNDEH